MSADERRDGMRIAIDLVLVPSRVRAMKAEPLPENVPYLLRIAVGDGKAAQEAAELTEKPLETIRAAAAFFIEQILLDPGCDSYRILGARPSATSAELRRNMALLVRWLHPDLDRNADRSIFAGRVTGAWDNLKTPERRAAYNKARSAAKAERRARRADRFGGLSSVQRNREDKRYANRANSGKMRDPPRAIGVRRRERGGLVRRAILFLLGRREH